MKNYDRYDDDNRYLSRLDYLSYDRDRRFRRLDRFLRDFRRSDRSSYDRDRRSDRSSFSYEEW